MDRTYFIKQSDYISDRILDYFNQIFFVHEC